MDGGSFSDGLAALSEEDNDDPSNAHSSDLQVWMDGSSEMPEVVWRYGGRQKCEMNVAVNIMNFSLHPRTICGCIH